MTARKTLEGKVVALGITGSIAAVEVVRLIHALRRKGAEVRPVMSQAAAGILHPDAVTYAAGTPVITRCTGMVEHVVLCGEGGSADVLLIAPCTANTLGKVACGIDDTPVTTFATTALGSGIPVVMAPAMHESMYRHPAVQENLSRLAGWGVDVIEPRREEGKAKMADAAAIILHTERAVSGTSLSGRRVLVTGGACAEPVDDVRILTTRSSGRMGREVALQAYRLGADVTLVHGGEEVPCVRNIRVSSAGEMAEAVLRIAGDEGCDIYVSAAAISDFAPERYSGKIPSGKPVEIRLRPLPKLLDRVREVCHPRIIAFKVGGAGARAARRMLDGGADLVVVNPPDAMGAEEGEFTILGKDTRIRMQGTKEEAAATLWDAVR
ncbi:MAG: bifunctional phosphopantothenoylcysteine decarboxylase/phosphopantothenate--cysteine ligase CoaBC [Methanomicrobiales archaeon]|nr:bifunctional phosphopantothenoylcysteine decarboxylase/phosphopantothenate--cysteine ligase CoaBC [Methanomicrobiales archaeon]